MPINFSADRWERLKENNKLWWAGKLGRPCIQLYTPSGDPGRPEPEVPGYSFTSFYDFSVPVEDIVDRWDYNLSCQKYFGDAYPHIFPNFGAGALAAFLGTELKNDDQTTWFHTDDIKEVADLKLHLNPNNIWYKRVKDICKAAMDRWQGSVQVSMTDIGGILDVLSSFRTAERLLMDLYDCPDDVKARINDLHKLWWQCYDEINSILQPTNPGHTAWAGIFSTEPHYMLQSDFAYMIGPDMFDEFVLPELSTTCKRLTNAFYHLDGQGQLPHLDSLLSIPELKGIQWVPGDGSPGLTQWPHVMQKIHNTGRKIHLWGSIKVLDEVVQQLGSGENIVFVGYTDNEEEAIDCLKRYGIDEV